jgi:hypothetical protein
MAGSDGRCLESGWHGSGFLSNGKLFRRQADDAYAALRASLPKNQAEKG